jgi:hypothetical protein
MLDAYQGIFFEYEMFQKVSLKMRVWALQSFAVFSLTIESRRDKEVILTGFHKKLVLLSTVSLDDSTIQPRPTVVYHAAS